MRRIATMVLCAAVGSACAAPAEQEVPDWEAQIRAVNEALLNQGDLGVVPEYFAESYVSHEPDGDLLGREGIADYVAALRDAFPDLTVEVEVLATDGDRVTWLRTARGTQEGDLMGWPATGRSVEWRDMIVTRYVGGLIAEEWGVSDLMPTIVAAQTDQPDVIGLVRNEGFAYLHYRWEDARWSGMGRERMEGTQIYFVDTAGGREQDVLDPVGDDAPSYSPTTAHRVARLWDRADPNGWYRQPIGYFVTRDVAHAPFSTIESPLSDEEWEEILADVQPPPADTVPDRLSVKVWRATLGSESVTYFAVDRQGDLSPGCPPLFRFTGWFPANDTEPVFTGVEDGDCDGKGAWRRQPYALLRRGGTLFLLIGKLGWEDDAVDLWQVDEGELRPTPLADSR